MYSCQVVLLLLSLSLSLSHSHSLSLSLLLFSTYINLWMMLCFMSLSCWSHDLTTDAGQLASLQVSMCVCVWVCVCWFKMISAVNVWGKLGGKKDGWELFLQSVSAVKWITTGSNKNQFLPQFQRQMFLPDKHSPLRTVQTGFSVVINLSLHTFTTPTSSLSSICVHAGPHAIWTMSKLPIKSMLLCDNDTNNYDE